MGERTACIVVFSLALVVRLGFLALTANPPILQPPVRDALEYHSYAVSVVERGVYEANGIRASRVPGYPLFLAAIYRVFGPNPIFPALAQALLGALACMMLYLLARKWLENDWALATGLAAACYYDMIVPGIYLLSETLAIFLLVAFLLAWFRGPRHWLGGLLPGLFLGLAHMVRTEFGPVALGSAIIAGAFFLRSHKPAERWRAGACALAFALTVSPWIARNYHVFHKFIPGSSVASAQQYAVGWGTIKTEFPSEGASLKLDDYPPPAGLPEGDWFSFYARRTKEFYHQAPTKLLIKAFAWNAATLFYPFLPEYDVTFVLLLPFFLYGYWLAVDRKDLIFPLAFAFMLVVAYVFGVQTGSRYRQMLAPFILLMGFLALRDLRSRLGGRFAPAIGAWCALQLILWLGAPQARGLMLGLRRIVWF